MILEVVISDGLWKRGFGGDPHILGKSLRLDNDQYHVVGVLPPGFRDEGRTTEERSSDLWAAAGFSAIPFPPPMRNSRFVPGVIARIAPGMTLAAAQSRMDALVASLEKQYPADYPIQSAWKVRLVPLKETVVGNVRQSLLLLLGAVGLVLLIGYVNVANLLLARASVRAREMALRQALGAGRKRLIRQLLTESLLLSLLGGATGIAILFATKGLLLRMVPESLPRLNDISISWNVLLFAPFLTGFAGILFGLAPASQASRLNLTRQAQGGRARRNRIGRAGAHAARAGRDGICALAGPHDRGRPSAAQFLGRVHRALGVQSTERDGCAHPAARAQRSKNRYLRNPCPDGSA
jgi:putative ABC transport system permease protein